MRESQLFALVLIASILLTMAVFPPSSVAAAKGPREDDMTLNFYHDIEVSYTAFKCGDVDVVLSALTNETAEDAFTDPNIVTAPVADSGFYEFDLNNNYSIEEYPGIRSPMNYTEMRQAIAFMTDKNFIVNIICGGVAERIDQMIAAPYAAWVNASVSYPYYPYEYNLDAAKALLDSTFPEGTTPNPDYNDEPWSAQYIRQYPTDHALAGTDLDPLVVCIRTDDNERYLAGIIVAEVMERQGIPLNRDLGTKAALYDRVMGHFNYHFYTGRWSVGRVPALSLYNLYHSDFAHPYSLNYVTGRDTHPCLDSLLHSAAYAAEYNASVTYTQRAAGYMTDHCVTIPLWSDASYWAWRTNLLGVVNMEGVGPMNPYTFMNAYKIDGSPIRCAMTSYPNSLNVIYSSWTYDWQCLDRLNLFSGLDVPPYGQGYGQAGWVKDWEMSTWEDGGETKTKVTRWFRDDAYFAEPVTGNQKARVNASHFFFSAWCEYAADPNTPHFPKWKDLHHIDVVDDFTVEIYFDSLSLWHTYAADGPMLPMDTWMAQGENFINQTVEAFVDPTTPGAIGLTADPIWIDYVTFDGTPLAMFTDYNIVEGELYIYSTLSAGTLEVSYRYVPSTGYGLYGCTPGALAWQIILEGAGMYYITAYTPLAGGCMTLKRNPYYWMATPPLGEVDWVWHWEEGSKPRSGGFKLDADDLALVAAALGSQGTGLPSSSWFPGADLVPPGGVVDANDMAVVLSGPHEVGIVEIAPAESVGLVGDEFLLEVKIQNYRPSEESVNVTLYADVNTSVVGDEVTVGRKTVAVPMLGLSTTLFSWNTLGLETGNYSLTAVADPLPGETYLEDNTRTQGVVKLFTPFHDVAVSTISPLRGSGYIGDEFRIDVELRNYGPSPESVNTTLYADADMSVVGDEILVGTSMVTVPYFGSFTTAFYWGTAGLDAGVYGLTAAAAPLPGETNVGDNNRTQGQIELFVFVPVHDVGVVDIRWSESYGYVGDVFRVEVDVQSYSNVFETVNITVYADANMSLVGDEVIIGYNCTGVPTFSSVTVVFQWDTLGVAAENYTITASIGLLPGEVNLEDNTKSEGSIAFYESVPCDDISITCPTTLTVNPSIFSFDYYYQARLINVGNVTIKSTGYEGPLRVLGSSNGTIRLCVNQPNVDRFMFFLPLDGEIQVPLWLMFQPSEHWGAYVGNYTLKLTVCGTHRRQLSIVGIDINVCQNGAYVVSDDTVTFTWNLTGGSWVYLEALATMPSGWSYTVEPAVGTLFETPHDVHVNITAPPDAQEGAIGVVTLRAYKNATGTLFWQFEFFASTDNNPPIIEALETPVLSPDCGLLFNATVTDPSGIDRVQLHYAVDGGAWQNETMIWAAGDTFSSTQYTLAVDAGAESASVQYYVTACDWLGNETQTQLFTVSTIADIAVTATELSKTIVGEGFGSSLNVTVTNQGPLPVSFVTLAIYDNGTVVKSQVLANLLNGTSRTLTIVLDPSALQKGSHTLAARVLDFPTESDTADNSKTAEPLLFITIPGDVNGDRHVNIFDIVSMAGKYGKYIPPDWPLPPQDIDGDEDVDIFDLVLAAGNYGKHW